MKIRFLTKTRNPTGTFGGRDIGPKWEDIEESELEALAGTKKGRKALESGELEVRDVMNFVAVEPEDGPFAPPPDAEPTVEVQATDSGVVITAVQPVPFPDGVPLEQDAGSIAVATDGTSPDTSPSEEPQPEEPQPTE